MDFSVTITTVNRAEGLRHALSALAAQDHDLARTEIIVADNGSTDHTKAVTESFAHRFPNLRYLFDARPGQLVGWHRALAVATGEIACFVDDDVRVSPSWLSALSEAYRDPQLGLVTGPIRLVYDAPPPDWIETMTLGEPGALTLPFLGGLDCGDAIRDIPGNFVWGSNFTVRRSILAEVRGFHPGAMPWSLIRFYGDGEIHVGRTAQQRGHRILYHPRAAVDHDIPASRLTFDGVVRKFTTTGCARSFQTLRASGRAYDPPSADDIRAIARRYFREGAKAPADLVRAVEIGLDQGMTQQRGSFVSDPAFRAWVLNDDYLDLDRVYSHPDLIAGAQRASDDWRSGA